MKQNKPLVCLTDAETTEPDAPRIVAELATIGFANPAELRTANGRIGVDPANRTAGAPPVAKELRISKSAAGRLHKKALAAGLFKLPCGYSITVGRDTS